MAGKPTLLAPRKYATVEEQELAERLNEMGGKMLSLIDAACRLRTAPPDAKRHRAYMRSSLEQAVNNGMDAYAHSSNPKEEPDG